MTPTARRYPSTIRNPEDVAHKRPSGYLWLGINYRPAHGRHRAAQRAHVITFSKLRSRYGCRVWSSARPMLIHQKRATQRGTAPCHNSPSATPAKMLPHGQTRPDPATSKEPRHSSTTTGLPPADISGRPLSPPSQAAGGQKAAADDNGKGHCITETLVLHARSAAKKLGVK